MNKVYFVIPLIGLLIFGGFYYNFTSQYEAKAKEAAARVEQDKKDRAARDVKNREALANPEALDLFQARHELDE